MACTERFARTGIHGIRYAVLRAGDVPLDVRIDAVAAIPRIVEALLRHPEPDVDLLHEALFALIDNAENPNYPNNTFPAPDAVVACLACLESPHFNIVDLFIRYLASCSPAEQLGPMLDAGVLPRMLVAAARVDNKIAGRCCPWHIFHAIDAIRRLRRPPWPVRAQLAPAVAAVAAFLGTTSDPDLTLSCVKEIAASADGMAAVLGHPPLVAAVIDRLLDPSAVSSALYLVSDMVAADPSVMTDVVRRGGLSGCHTMFQRHDSTDACRVFAQMCAGSPTNICAVIGAGLMPRLLSLCHVRAPEDGSDRLDGLVTRQFALATVCNSCCDGTLDQVAYLVSTGVLEVLSNVLADDVRRTPRFFEACHVLLATAAQHEDRSVRAAAAVLKKAVRALRAQVQQNDGAVKRHRAE